MTAPGPQGLGARDALAWATSPILLAGLYVWAIACAPVFALWFRGLSDHQGAARVAAAAASVSLLCLIAGVALERSGRREAIFIGIWGFLGASTVAWLVLREVADVSHLDVIHGGLATLGFCLYALAWGVPAPLHKLRPEDNPRAENAALAPRGRPAFLARPLLSFGVIVAAASAGIAWRAQDSTRAVVAQAAASATGVAVLSAAGRIGVGRNEGVPSRVRLRRASRPLAAAIVLGILAAVYALAAR